ncbi:MmcQ/YjbR family DNA-binding protein [Fumia xinanensis]|uniref:MmcQ/YjbR family DNA-binding protein n=1 Tax=Fumia xinanensis TaxID=2763659 RepID=A0A926E4C9_9FIRM|nr:MmcQ/YjbR family DNA-binding protein [Fumia xinanensis]MBC8559295.1 MmcQ/YjbR family DNA-binding protein [Fumia xinanensis]
MTQEKLRDYMLTFADAEEYSPFDDTGPIYRHKSNGKWFGFFAELSGKPCVILKCEPLEADFLRQAYRGVTPGWHMNKQHWNTVELCSDVPPEEIEKMVQMSFRLTAPKVQGKRRG